MTSEGMPIHICVRSTVDWQDEAAFQAQLDPRFRPKVEVWNRTFSLPSHLFRRELRAIAQSNLERVEGAVLCAWAEVPDGVLVVPVDDDDWFAPHLVPTIRAVAGPEVHALRWRQGVVEVPINAGHRLRLLLRRLIPCLRPRWLCSTNSYVIRKGCVDPRCFNSHVAASRWFPLQDADRIRVLPERLSVHNRSLASITALNYGKPFITPRQLRQRRVAYSRLYRRRQAMPADLAWSIPSLQRMEALMERLGLAGR